MNSVSPNNPSNKRLSCAICGSTDGPLYYAYKHKFFWCSPCRYQSLSNKTEFLTLDTQEVDGTYYVYALLDPRDLAPRYIGMSEHPKARLIEHHRNKECRQKYIWLCELKQQGLEPVLNIIEEIHNTRQHAYKREGYWIQQYAAQGASLFNALPGKRKSRHRR